MNSSLQRVCASRGRLIHRSKNLERHVLVLPSGAEVFLGMRPSTQKINGRNDGVTANFGIKALKRDNAHSRRNGWFLPGSAMRALKADLWLDRANV